MARRKGTSTSNFGVGKRESHDASGFYERFEAPKIERDEKFVPDPSVPSGIYRGDSADMSKVPDNSVALVVTSPPYFAGKQYEEEYEREGVPASYIEYLQMLEDVFAECHRVLEPGGRIAVNVANLGRKPYRSLSADVIDILQNSAEFPFLLRGEILWQKGEGANGSCAWGSFRSAANPVLRDITERVIVASKGQLDRAMKPKKRAELGLPHRSDLLADDFMALTLDLWKIPAESAQRINHPAPFPVELPEQLIRLFTYENDLVLDPFVGSGSSLVAATRLGRRYVGYDLDETYIALANERVAAELTGPPDDRGAVEVAALDGPPDEVDEANFQARATREGKVAQKLALERLTDAGFTDIEENKRIKGTGVVVNFIAKDSLYQTWFFDVSGAFTSHRGGLLRTDTVWKALGRAFALRGKRSDVPVVLLTSNLPKPKSEGDTALRAAGPNGIFDAISMLSADGLKRLRSYYERGAARPIPGFWTEGEIADAFDRS